jgi:hypothetical protein
MHTSASLRVPCTYLMAWCWLLPVRKPKLESVNSRSNISAPTRLMLWPTTRSITTGIPSFRILEEPSFGMRAHCSRFETKGERLELVMFHLCPAGCQCGSPNKMSVINEHIVSTPGKTLLLSESSYPRANIVLLLVSIRQSIRFSTLSIVKGETSAFLASSDLLRRSCSLIR